MLCQLHLEPSVLRLSGSRADDFNVLEPQTDLSQTVVSIKPRQLGPAKLNRRIWVVSRRQTLWLHSNPRSDSLGSLLAARYAQTLESVCFNDTMVIYCMRILFAALISECFYSSKYVSTPTRFVRVQTQTVKETLSDKPVFEKSYKLNQAIKIN